MQQMGVICCSPFSEGLSRRVSLLSDSIHSNCSGIPALDRYDGSNAAMVRQLALASYVTDNA